MKDKLRAEGFISIRDQPKQEREKNLQGKGKLASSQSVCREKRKLALKKKKKGPQSLKLYALSSSQKS